MAQMNMDDFYGKEGSEEAPPQANDGGGEEGGGAAYESIVADADAGADGGGAPESGGEEEQSAGGSAVEQESAGGSALEQESAGGESGGSTVDSAVSGPTDSGELQQGAAGRQLAAASDPSPAPVKKGWSAGKRCGVVTVAGVVILVVAVAIIGVSLGVLTGFDMERI